MFIITSDNYSFSATLSIYNLPFESHSPLRMITILMK
jgi:hypothetical protein